MKNNTINFNYEGSKFKVTRIGGQVSVRYQIKPKGRYHLLGVFTSILNNDAFTEKLTIFIDKEMQLKML